ncbi:DUF2066 domain-containing protein [Planctobacterium marinum]|uniref:DUF2066 domain-containing protein n=1 Tax=Planctobacterium marinum TaxID=1631968 RepID=UPI00360B0BEF
MIQNLYETKVRVNSQTVAAQNNAIRDSYYQVLVKVSGSKSITEVSELTSKAGDARDLIQSFRFEIIDGERFMVAQFDEGKINQLLTDIGKPIWGKRRPDTLLWFTWLNERDDRELVTATADPEVKKILLEQAQIRGIPFSFPLMDIEDAQIIHVYDVWGRFDGVVKRASQRYPNDNLVAARLFDRRQLTTANTEVSEQMRWQIDWQVLNDELIEEGTLFAAERNQVVTQFIDMLANKLAEKFAVVSRSYETQNSVTMTIINLDSIEAYVSAKKFLESLAIVNSVRLLNVSGQNATFQLDIVGVQEDLINTLELDAKISQKTDPFGRVVNEMEFIWLR